MMNQDPCRHFLDDKLAEPLADCLAVAVERGGKTLFEYHKTNHAKPEYADFSTATCYNIGSVTKVVTGALIVKLVENGMVSLNDPVKKYIPEYPFEEPELIHLLYHSAGYGSRELAGISWPTRLDGRQEYLDKIYAIKTLTHPVGEVAEYWSYGYSILMDVLERVTGMTLEEFARRELFDPLGMERTTFDVTRVPARNRILPLNPDGASFRNLANTPPTGDSGLYSTPAELLKFSRNLLETHKTRRGGAFSEFAVDLMFRESTGNRFERTPVFWRKGDCDQRRCFGALTSPEALCHTGFSGCMLLLDPAGDLSVAILSNSMKLHEDWRNYGKIVDVLLSHLS